jgi:hypothetical protein
MAAAWLDYYNFGRIHKTLRITPAMAWSFGLQRDSIILAMVRGS